MIVFNNYTNLYTLVTFIAIFEANGLLATSVKLYNMKKEYYKDATSVFRFAFEIFFAILLILYLILEIQKLWQEIST